MWRSLLLPGHGSIGAFLDRLLQQRPKSAHLRVFQSRLSRRLQGHVEECPALLRQLLEDAVAIRVARQDFKNPCLKGEFIIPHDLPLPLIFFDDFPAKVKSSHFVPVIFQHQSTPFAINLYCSDLLASHTIGFSVIRNFVRGAHVTLIVNRHAMHALATILSLFDHV